MQRLGFLLCLMFLQLSNADVFAASAVLLGWNNLGMHCMDSRYAEFAILPPYNTIDAQLIVNGKLVTASTIPGAAEYTLTYEAVADPVTGILNSTSKDKSDWASFAPSFFPALKGLNPPYLADMGLANCNMPGIDSPYVLNTPQAIPFQPAGAPSNTFQAEGVPITPTDDAGNKNFYPMMRLVARNASNAVIAQSDVVLPVSDEMTCKSCHAANTNTDARPASGWIADANPEREYRLNILRLHDDIQFAEDGPLYNEALAAKGIDSKGLFASVTTDQDPVTPGMQTKPVLCASCHTSEALGTPSFTGTNGTVSALTTAMHSLHANVTTPGGSQTLNDASNRAACYDCHPGSKTKCLRGAMGSAVATDGSMEMQCQSCHGNMTKVGDSHRTGWLQEPTCQSCHTGTATSNNGKIRYSSVFNNPQIYDSERVAVNQTFATNTNTPAAGLSLYRFSKGHGGLQCAACHGSTHAEFPSSHTNDNVRNVQLQGHAGVTVECTACHATAPTSPNGGPHGLHPINQSWVNNHHDQISQAGGIASCKSCHGADLKGTELSRVQGDRSFRFESQTVKFYRGGTVGCYSCHNGPSSESFNNSAAPQTNDISATTSAGTPVNINLPGNATGVTLRILQQPQHGTAGLTNGVATYYPDEGFSGTDSFLFAGYNGAKNSVNTTNNKGAVPATATITVNQACSYAFQPTTQASGEAGGSYSVNLITDANCAWQLQSDASWLSLSSTASGSGSATVQFNVAGNTLVNSRNAHINLSGAGSQVLANLTVNQDAATDSDHDGVPDRNDNCKLVANTNQRNTDGDLYGNICDPDFNQNNIVDPADMSQLKAKLGQASANEDLNGNGIVDPADMSLLKSYLGKAPGPSGLAP